VAAVSTNLYLGQGVDHLISAGSDETVAEVLEFQASREVEGATCPVPMETGASSFPKLLLAYRNKSAMSQTEVAEWLCIPVCFAAFAFADDDPLVTTAGAGLAFGGQYTFYVWAKVASGTKQVSVAIVDNGYAGCLAGPTSTALTTAWQRFKITGTLAGGQTGLWIVVRQFAGNGDNWTAGAIYLWGACLQQGNDPKSGYARTWASQTAFVAAGVACGAVVISAKDNAESPLRIPWRQNHARSAFYRDRVRKQVVQVPSQVVGARGRVTSWGAARGQFPITPFQVSRWRGGRYACGYGLASDGGER
jgi:hypothetical protein